MLFDIFNIFPYYLHVNYWTGKSFRHPNNATHKIGQLASEIFKFKSVIFSSLKGK